MSLTVTDLSYAFGQKQALDGVSFSVELGSFCALLGPNGAGKSTLFNLLTRLFTSSQGAIHIAGTNLAAAPRLALAQMGVVFQQTTLDLDLTVRQNLKYFAALQGIAGRAADMACDQAMDRLNIADRATARARDLNGGHRRRLELARALLHEPSVLLLDEPTVGLDAASRQALTAHVHDLATDHRLTVLWATHLTDEIIPSDQVVVLHQGRVMANDTADTISGGASLRDRFLDMTASRLAA